MKISGNEDFLLFDKNWHDLTVDMIQEDTVFHSMSLELKRRCDMILQPDNPMYLNPEDRESKWWKTRTGNKQLVVYTLDLAMAAYIFQDERYSQAAASVFNTLSKYNMPENSGGTSYGRPYKSWIATQLDAGHASEALGLSLNLLVPFLDGKQIMSAGRYLEKFIKALEYFADAHVQQEPFNFKNIPMIASLSMGVLAAALQKLDILNAEKHLQISRHAALQFLDEGGHEQRILPEGPMYGFACLKHIAVLGTVLYNLGDDSIWKSSSWDRIVEVYVSQVIPGDGTINPLNDCYEIMCTAWLPAVARYRKNNLARWLWENVVSPLENPRWDASVAWDDIRAPWWNACLPFAMAVYPPDVLPSCPEKYGVPLKKHFNVRGVVDCRTGWAENDWYLSVTCCPDVRWRNRRTDLHSQADRGHFSFYALGEKFAVDSGYGNEILTGSTEVLRLGRTGEAHNVPEIDGAMQKTSLHASGVKHVALNSWIDAVAVSYPEAYNNCSRVDRTIFMVYDMDKEPLYLLVYDSIFPHRPSPYNTYDLLLHTEAGNSVKILGRERAEITGARKGNRCYVMMTANRPGCMVKDGFTGHPRLRYKNSAVSLYALTILLPCSRTDKPPVIWRSSPDNNRGFALSLKFRGCEDRIISCAEGTFSGLELETDAELSIVREKGADTRYAAVAGTFLRKNGVPLFAGKPRNTFMLQG